MMRVLVTGARGMLGQELVEALSWGHVPLPAIHAGEEGYPCDITDTGAVFRMMEALQPEAVIHAAAWTDVDGCEASPDLAYRVNALGTWNIASACARHAIPVAYISSDFVFDGAKDEPYLEWDRPHPLSHYGLSKWMGEQHIQALCQRFWIVRTAWLFGVHGKSFPKTILNAACTKTELRVIADQIGSPTYAPDLAQKIVELLEKPLYGIYHITNQGQCSWYELACKTLELARIEGVRIVPIPSSEWPSPTKRPAFSALRPFHLELAGIPLLRPWEEALQEFVLKSK